MLGISSWSCPSLALDSRTLVHVPVRIHAHVRQKVRDGLGCVSRLGEPLLAETVVHAPLQRVHQAAGHAVTGPSLERANRFLLRGEFRQILGADALAALAVTAGAGEIPWPGAEVEDLAAEAIGLALL